MKTNNVIFTCGMIVMAIVIFVMNIGCVASTDHYAKSAQVVEIDRAADVVTVVDCMGDLWEFTGAEDWEIGDWCAMIMNDRGTPSVYDDEIISVRYECWDHLD